MFDLLYIAGTLLFFAAMLAYVKGCASLGARSTSEQTSGDAP